jgi:hypothetical protein
MIVHNVEPEHSRRLRWAALAVGILTACSAGSRRRDTGDIVTPGRVGNRHESHLEQPLPEGRAVAFFALSTGRDQMTTGRRPDASLDLIVRYGASELRQTIASCHEATLGSALGGGTGTVLEVAGCDGELWLSSKPGLVWVDRMDGDKVAARIASIRLPRTDMRADPPPKP